MTRVARRRRTRRPDRLARRAADTRVIGPTVRDGAIVYDELESAADAAGRLDGRPGRRQLPARAPRRRGALRLRRRADLVEALPVPAAGSPVAGDAGRRRARGRGGAARPSARSRSSASRRASSPRSPIQDRVLARRPLRRPRLRGAPRGRLPRRGQLPRARRHLLLRLDGHRPDVAATATTSSSPSSSSGGHRFLVEAGSERGDGDPRGARRRRGDRRGPARGRRRRRSTPPARMGRQLDTDDIRDLLRDEPRAPALGRGRRALPDLRQLHARLPDLLLHRRSRTRTTWRAAAERSRVWDSCFSVDYSYIHGGAIRQSPRGPLPPVAHPQARHLARPVRQLGLRRLRPLHHLVPGRHRHHRGGRRDPRDREGGRMKTLDARRRREPGLRGPRPAVPRADRRLRQNTGFERRRLPVPRGRPGRHLLPRPPRARACSRPSSRAAARVTIETIDDGDVVGWSWLFPPYRWHFDARALDVVRAVAFDGACLRGKCDDDHAFGYELLDRFSPVMLERLQATRLQLLDVYGNGAALSLAARWRRGPFRVERRMRETHDTWTLSLAPVQRRAARRSHPGSSRCSTPSASARCRSRSAARRSSRRSARSGR